MSYLDITLCSLTEIIGDFNLKAFANSGGIKSFSLGIIGYIGVIYYLIRSLQGSTVLVVNTAWDGISTIIESLAAYFILGERLNSASEYVGLVFIMAGLFLLKLPLMRQTDFIMPSFF